MRVVHVGRFQRQSASGVDKTLIGLVEGIRDRGADVEVWHFSNQLDGINEWVENQLHFLELPEQKPPLSMVSPLPSASRALVLERTAEIDILHFHSVFIRRNTFLARMLKRPYVITPNGGYSPSVIQGRRRVLKAAWMKAFEREYIRNASLVHVVSPQEESWIRAIDPDAHTEYIPNGVAGPLQTLAGNRFERKAYFLFMGRLDIDHKGLDRLVHGFHSFSSQERGADARLIIAGPDFREGEAKLRQLVADLGIQDRVELRGAVFGKEKEELLDGAHSFVHCSRWEGLPFAVLESLSVGCPVLVTPETNLGDDVRKHECGVVVSGQTHAIAAGLGQLWSASKGEYLGMQRNAIRLVKEHFALDVITDKMLQAYERVLQDASR